MCITAYMLSFSSLIVLNYYCMQVVIWQGLHVRLISTAWCLMAINIISYYNSMFISCLRVTKHEPLNNTLEAHDTCQAHHTWHALPSFLGSVSVKDRSLWSKVKKNHNQIVARNWLFSNTRLAELVLKPSPRKMVLWC